MTDEHDSRPPPLPHAPIEREIERSRRASQALAATREWARTSTFADSQSADQPTEYQSFDPSGWAPTEYTPLVEPAPMPAHAGAARGPASPAPAVGAMPAPGRAMPAAAVQPRPVPESRPAPHDSRFGGQIAVPVQSPATALTRPAAVARAPEPAPVVRHAPASGSNRVPIVAALLGLAVLAGGGGVAWKMSRPHAGAQKASVQLPVPATPSSPGQ